jgi:hypothetical protein
VAWAAEDRIVAAPRELSADDALQAVNPSNPVPHTPRTMIIAAKPADTATVVPSCP